MAEASPPVADEASPPSDEPDGSVLLSGEVLYKGVAHQLVLLKTGLRLLTPPTVNKKTGTAVDSELTLSALSLFHHC
jgi:hypothetical protein